VGDSRHFTQISTSPLQIQELSPNHYYQPLSHHKTTSWLEMVHFSSDEYISKVIIEVGIEYMCNIKRLDWFSRCINPSSAGGCIVGAGSGTRTPRGRSTSQPTAGRAPGRRTPSAGSSGRSWPRPSSQRTSAPRAAASPRPPVDGDGVAVPVVLNHHEQHSDSPPREPVHLKSTRVEGVFVVD
jgi:hypothetical protein